MQRERTGESERATCDPLAVRLKILLRTFTVNISTQPPSSTCNESSSLHSSGRELAKELSPLTIGEPTFWRDHQSTTL